MECWGGKQYGKATFSPLNNYVTEVTPKATTAKCCLLNDQSKKNTHLNRMVKPHAVFRHTGRSFQVCEQPFRHAQLHADLYCLPARILKIAPVRDKEFPNRISLTFLYAVLWEERKLKAEKIDAWLLNDERPITSIKYLGTNARSNFVSVSSWATQLKVKFFHLFPNFIWRS